MEGYLSKWTNLVEGWNKRYWVLHNGVFSYCKDKGTKLKGNVHLKLATLIPHAKNNKRFSIETGTYLIELKGYSLSDANRWQEAIKE